MSRVECVFDLVGRVRVQNKGPEPAQVRSSPTAHIIITSSPRQLATCLISTYRVIWTNTAYSNPVTYVFCSHFTCLNVISPHCIAQNISYIYGMDSSMFSLVIRFLHQSKVERCSAAHSPPSSSARK